MTVLEAGFTQSLEDPHAYLREDRVSELYDRLMHTILERQHSTLILDLSEFDSFDSNELMTLLPALSMAQKLHQRIIFCGVAASIRLVFEITQLDRVFAIAHETLIPERKEGSISEVTRTSQADVKANRHFSSSATILALPS